MDHSHPPQSYDSNVTSPQNHDKETRPGAFQDHAAANFAWSPSTVVEPVPTAPDAKGTAREFIGGKPTQLPSRLSSRPQWHPMQGKRVKLQGRRRQERLPGRELRCPGTEVMGQESYFLNIAKGAEMLRGNPSQERNECMYSRTRMGSLSNWVDVWTGPEWLDVA
jgi:hypothetical protein